MTQLHIKEGETCRVSFPLTSLAGTSDASDQEIPGFRKLPGQPLWKTLVVVWPIYENGNPKWGFRMDWRIQTFLLGEDAFRTLLRRHQEWSLREHDYLFEGRHNRVHFPLPCKTSLFRGLLQDPSLSEKIMVKLTEFLTEASEMPDEPVTPKEPSGEEIYYGIDWGKGPDRSVQTTYSWTDQRKHHLESSLEDIRKACPRWDWQEINQGYLCFQGVKGSMVLELEANQNLAWTFSLFKGPPSGHKCDRKAFTANGYLRDLREFLVTAREFSGATFEQGF